MTKEQLRANYRQKRAELTDMQRDKMEDLILIQFQKLDIEIPSMVMTYAPARKHHEFDPQLITDYCYFKNPQQTLFYPVIDPKDNSMKSVVVTDDTIFSPNIYGIDEPVDGLDMFPGEIDMVIAPLLAFDEKGHRIGYGKGYYDRFFKKCRKDVIKIGFSYFPPEPKIEGMNRYDVRLNYCITPERIYQFN